MGVQVKWRAPLVAAAGLLLTMPFMLALGLALYPGRVDGPKATVEVLPVLSALERRELLTLERPCQRREDCEPGLGCLKINPGGPSVCVASECMTDLQCEEGFTCRALSTVDRGPWVRWCILEGQQKEGEPCMQGLSARGSNCARGLLCAAWCGRPCELDAPGSCPEGFFCRKGPDGPSCLPTCEGRTCAEGQQCIRFEGGTSVCAAVRGQDCQQAPCAEGFECRRSFPRTGPQGLVVGMECVQPCGEEKPPCPEGLVCSSGVCRHSCEPDAPGSCGPHEACKQGPVKEQWVCQLQTKP
jgi:hypothetical protein